MIQRIQTIWLALAAIFQGLTFKLPFYTGDWKEDSTPAAVDLNAQTSLTFSIVAAIVIAVAILAIFLFRNRRLQQFACGAGLGLSATALGLYLLELKDFTSGSFALWVVVYAAVLLFFLLATRGIRADEKLIKSMDRLR